MYKFLGNGVIRLSDQAYVPFDTGNADYLVYLSYCETGGKVQPMDPVDQSDVAQRALMALEASTMMGRGMREYLLVSMQDLAMRQAEQAVEAGHDITAEAILAAQPAWSRLVQINAQAIALRSKIK